MFSKPINNILTLLAVTVFVDKRIYANEIDSFMESAGKLSVFEESTLEVTPAKLLHWFEMNRDDLKTRMSKDPSFKDWLNDILSDLKDHPDRFVILNRMIEISKADGQIHYTEKDLISSTAKLWDINLAA